MNNIIIVDLLFKMPLMHIIAIWIKSKVRMLVFDSILSIYSELIRLHWGPKPGKSCEKGRLSLSGITSHVKSKKPYSFGKRSNSMWHKVFNFYVKGYKFSNFPLTLQ